MPIKNYTTKKSTCLRVSERFRARSHAMERVKSWSTTTRWAVNLVMERAEEKDE